MPPRLPHAVLSPSHVWDSTADTSNVLNADAGADGWIVNRKRSAEAGWDDVPPTRDPRELIWHDVERELIGRERAEELLRDLED